MRDALSQRGMADVRLSGSPGEERRLARDAALAGVGTIIALGGDGTWGNVARGILDSGRPARLALLAAGTGNDFAQSLRLPVHDARSMLDIALGQRERHIDVGRVDGVHFINVAGFGIATSVLESIRRPRLLKGAAAYLAAALPQLLRYQPLSARLGFGMDAPGEPGRYLAIVLANGRRFGGGFRIAPDADVTDGALDVVTVRDAGVLRRAMILGRARMGRHLGLAEVEHRRVQSFTVTFPTAPELDVDGELMTARTPSIEVQCLAGALRVACA